MKVGGYWQVMLDRKRYLNHRIIAAIVGLDTSKLIDHINGDPTDNSPGNLRTASHKQNACNNSGWAKKRSRVGTWEKPNGRWIAYIRVDGRHKHLGTFANEAEAAAARVAAEEKHYGQFARALCAKTPTE